MRGNQHLTNQLAQSHDFFRGLDPLEHRSQIRYGGGRGRADDTLDLLVRGVREADLEEEAIELRLRQRICAFHLDGVERGQHEERRWQAIGGASHRYLQFGHRFQQRGLRLWRGAVDLIPQQNMSEDRSFDKDELTAALLSVHDHARAGDVRGHQVHSELDAVEAEVEHLGKRADDQGFASARHTLNQHVSASKEGNEDVFDHLIMADHRFRNFAADAMKGFLKLGNRAGSRGVTHCDSPRENRRLTISSYSGGIWALRIASSRDWRWFRALVDFSITPPSSFSSLSLPSPLSWVESSASWKVCVPLPRLA